MEEHQGKHLSSIENAINDFYAGRYLRYKKQPAISPSIAFRCGIEDMYSIGEKIDKLARKGLEL